MYRRIFLTVAIAGWLTCLPLMAQTTIRVRLLASFDYPGAGNSTTPQGINDQGDVVGYYEDSTGATRGFIRYADGTFGEPIVAPHDIGNFTVARDINNLGQICGYYYNNSILLARYAGFILTGRKYKEYVSSGSSYEITGLNDAGDICITFDDSYTKFCEIVYATGGTSYTVGDQSEVNGLTIHDATAGDYLDRFGASHGYLRSPNALASKIFSPIDFPGAQDTYLLGIDDGGRLVVGNYVDTGGNHALLFGRPDTFTSYDYPGASQTSFNAINNHQVVAGYYADGVGVRHGFLAKIIESH